MWTQCGWCSSARVKRLVQHSAAEIAAGTTLGVGGNRRNMREDAPLQNQFGKTSRARRASIEQERRYRASRVRGEGQFFEAKIGIGNASIISPPALRDCRNNRPQNFAALDPRRWRWCLGGLGMERTRAFGCVRFRCEHVKCAVIRNRDPRKDRDGNSDALHLRAHVA